MEGHPIPNSQRSCWRRALNPWQALRRALVSAFQSATPALCFPEWLPSQGQGHLLICWAWVLPGWCLCLWPPQTYRSQSSMLGTTVLLLALLPGISTLPSGPPGM